ncbi:hypothetical protein Enr13x_16200 [Stieleria neptunia]|uniref:Uncharacterized protein n=1 Tax=Stieleria neptunia TaxID=2527979 RepID=A0A518HLR7_9BACT|nr:hypothetical protein [Stieleria neptunia]QDV41777.1 hypothetical protein Enr13x_16200 [Stieleria neptunia]
MRLKRIWTIHISTLITMIIWAAMDPLFPTMVQRYAWAGPAEAVGWIRWGGLASLVVIAATSLAAVLMTRTQRWRVGLRQSSLRRLLAITTVIALWCGLVIHHESIAWQGKRVRFAWRIDELEAIVAPLRNQWPERDGELPATGPFMAYPFGRPTTLVLLQSPALASQHVYVSAIERCDDGAIKLQLTGTDGGDWAEWHPPHSRPISFVGGLADPHQLRTATAIGSGWYLVRYDA